MRNVTLAIEEEVLQEARIRAAKEGTTVNAVVREFLARYGARDRRLQTAMDRVLEAAAKYEGRLEGGKFRREAAYEERSRRGR
ncbi:MAG: hypothetical protein HUU06_13070 [Planctomycetaceae bacterium]|nr:hypothetical protein [Planctomycetota bacterium]NUN53697.1 hypothetical protein [Planctomycetaceae bacterium]